MASLLPPPFERPSSIVKNFKLPMKNLALLNVVAVCVVLTGCGTTGTSTSSNSAGSMPAATQTSDVMRVGDKIDIRLSGTPDQGSYASVQIPPSGDITMDLLSGTFRAAGKTPSELAADLVAAYKSQKIYTSPVVNVIPEERFINVGGDVRSPSRVVYSPDSTLMSTINSCGGFTEYANRRSVRIIRGSQVIVVDCVKAIQTPGADPAVFPGDQIYVSRSIF
jgi:protein involved in polysaccharide export with SLBB domain